MPKQRHFVGPESERLEAVQEQHRDRGGGEGHRLAQRRAVVAVEIGQHAGETAHCAAQDRRVERQTVDHARAGVAAAEAAADGHVHFEAGHGGAERSE